MVWQPDRLTPHLTPLAPCPWAGAPPFTVHHCDTIDSTNTQLWHWLDRGFPSGTVLIAQSQHSGRGQWDRSWQSEPGGLYLSLGLRPQNLPASEAQRLNFGTVWGIAQILQDCGFPIGLKWPNDLVAQGKKLGGVLIETRLRGGRISEAVVGVGLNWRNAVPTGAIALADLNPQSSISNLETLAAIVLQGLAHGYHHWLNPNTPLDRLLPDYLSHCINLHQTIPLPPNSPQFPPLAPSNPQEPPTGRIIGITPQGCLQVQIGTTLQTFQPGEIQLGYPDHA
ncbi:MAG: biotin--[acetyl-CoA-carboxylase] ligase [Prochlorothrix sp.]|nr:biotin--[acetyl-CoA-carboxylase] ligase [Prochlorothrix sp.]